MEDTNKHKVNGFLLVFIIIITAYAFVEVSVFIASNYFNEDVQCYWWGCKFSSNDTFFYSSTNMTYKEVVEFINDTTGNNTKCYYNNTWQNITCKELLKPEILKELEEVIENEG